MMQFVQGSAEASRQQSPEGSSQEALLIKRQEEYSTKENHSFHILQKDIVPLFLKTA